MPETEEVQYWALVKSFVQWHTLPCDKHVLDTIQDINETEDRGICLEELKLMIQINES